MCKAARKENKLLAIGHQRHYSVLYDNANELVKAGQLGEIRHIRALWHRNNGQPQVAKDKDGKLQLRRQGRTRLRPRRRRQRRLLRQLEAADPA